MRFSAAKSPQRAGRNLEKHGYLREHASEYGIDPVRIGALGDSAGGYVAQMLGSTNGERRFDKGVFLDKSSDVQAVVTAVRHI